ncbi:MAG: aldehyde dehydrogenase family protein [Alphaproteobacteria bacterium]|nr:aldehyde dehydrogenase family protein [Alphaproteobacteria bacterium]
MLFRKDAYIAGAWVSGKRRFRVDDPATGETIAEVPDLGAAETEAAIAAAHEAFPAWAGELAETRSALLMRWHDALMARADDVATLMTRECGKPLAESKGEVAYAASFLKWFAEEGRRAYGRTIPTTVSSRRYVVTRAPIGVAAAITPWNFPAAMIARKAGPALAAGCTLVVKPPHQTSLTALALMQLAEEAGLPQGVMNMVTTSDAQAVGAALCDSERVRKLSFTGSTAVGKSLAALSAGTMKRVSMELGGNAPALVFADCDLDVAVREVAIAKFRNSGQTCVCVNRVLVEDSIHDAFVEAFSAHVAAMKVGPGLEDGVQIGPLIDDKAMEKVTRLVQSAKDAGAQVVVGGEKHSAGARFYQPTVISGVSQDMAIAQEEIFGPVAPIIRFRDEAEALALANATPYGLAAYAFTQSLARAWRVSEKLAFGMVSLNDGILSTAVAPFGGVKDSGLGREGGGEGLDEYLDVKFTSFGGI